MRDGYYIDTSLERLLECCASSDGNEVKHLKLVYEAMKNGTSVWDEGNAASKRLQESSVALIGSKRKVARVLK